MNAVEEWLFSQGETIEPNRSPNNICSSDQPLFVIHRNTTTLLPLLLSSLAACNGAEIHNEPADEELCTDKIICLEYVEGCKITDLKAIEEYGYTGPEIAFKGISLYFEMVFDLGFFHADPHPGNIFVMQNGKICFLDFGMVGNILDGNIF